MTRDEIILQAALRMDEITPESGLAIPVDGTDNNPLYALIDGIADDCALELYASAPYWRLPPTAFLYDEIKVDPIYPTEPDSRKMIRLKVNDDFLRIAVVRCDEFQRPITEIFPEMSEMGKNQHNRYLMGKTAKPVGIMTHGYWNDGTSREIDCFSLAPDTAMGPRNGIEASYISKPGKAEHVPDRLVPALEWLIAARAFEARGDINHGKTCLENAQGLLV